jgi:hypothetical protein
MHPTSERDLRKLASKCLHKNLMDAWPIYRTEATTRYRSEDGPRDDYNNEAAVIFVKVAQNTKGGLRRAIRSGRIPMPTFPAGA